VAAAQSAARVAEEADARERDWQAELALRHAASGEKEKQRAAEVMIRTMKR